jgi:hypothetical protein
MMASFDDSICLGPLCSRGLLGVLGRKKGSGAQGPGIRVLRSSGTFQEIYGFLA